LVNADATGHTITLAVDGGAHKTFNVSTSAVIYFNGATSSLANLTPGAKVYLKLAADGVTATAVAASTHSDSDNPQPQATWITGSIVSVDTTAHTVTVSVAGGAITTFTLTSDTAVYLNGTQTTAAAIVAGQAAALKIAADGSTVLAIGVEKQNDPTPTGTQSHGNYVSGTVVSIDTVANTITVAVSGASNGTFNLTSSTVIYFDGAVSTLSAITTGARISMALASDGKTVLAMGSSDRPEGDDSH